MAANVLVPASIVGKLSREGHSGLMSAPRFRFDMFIDVTGWLFRVYVTRSGFQPLFDDGVSDA